MAKHTFSISTIRYYDKEDHYSIVKGINVQNGKAYSYLGIIPYASQGKKYSAEVTLEYNKKWGPQYKIEGIAEEVPPETTNGIITYLSSGTIKGIGPEYAKRIVEHFGLKTLDIIEHNPDRLLEVEGIGGKRMNVILESWKRTAAIRNLSLYLAPYNISAKKILQIYKRFQDKSIEILRNTPYRITEIYGIGFKIADEIAMKIGIDPFSEERIRAGILYTLEENENNGNTCMNQWNLIYKASELLNVEIMTIQTILANIKESGDIVLDYDSIYSGYMYKSEKNIAESLIRLTTTELPTLETFSENDLSVLEKELEIIYTEKQKDAIKASQNTKFMVLTGGPGTGKTTVLKGILWAMKQSHKKVVFAAPTGRAAKRMKESLGSMCTTEPKTIHRLLEFDPSMGLFKRGKDESLEGDVLIVDESSMLDTYLTSWLLNACPNKMQVIFVGDIDQLPSVGAGNVLRDIIESKRFTVVQLTEVMRQKQDSYIVKNAHLINQGKMPILNANDSNDFFFVPIEADRDDPSFDSTEHLEEIQKTIVHLVGDVLPEKYQISPYDIQVLAPMRKFPTGTYLLNIALQHKLQKIPGEHCGKLTENGGYPKMQYLEKDKVMQLKNNYNLDTYNGDIGIIHDYVKEDDTYIIRFPDDEQSTGYRDVEYEELDIMDVNLAYACTIHKSQGSEYPVVVIPMTTSNYIMLKRNLLYTAITRAKKAVVLVGELEAIKTCVRQADTYARLTHLRERLEL